MSNTTLKFKTNIKCGGCISTVTPFLDNISSVKKWEVDTDNKDKILTVEVDDITADVIIQKVQEAGFKIEML